MQLSVELLEFFCTSTATQKISHNRCYLRYLMWVVYLVKFRKLVVERLRTGMCRLLCYTHCGGVCFEFPFLQIRRQVRWHCMGRVKRPLRNSGSCVRLRIASAVIRNIMCLGDVCVVKICKIRSPMAWLVCSPCAPVDAARGSLLNKGMRLPRELQRLSLHPGHGQKKKGLHPKNDLSEESARSLK